MFDRIFRLSENHTTVRTELLAGLTTFLTMAYIIFLQPMVLSGALSGKDTGMDAGAITTATCLSAAVASLIMGLYARYPIAQAPGMGENFFFVGALLPAAAAAFAPDIADGQTTDWQIGLGVVFCSGLLFLVISLVGVREAIMETISPSLRDGIAVGIGAFITFIGFHNAGLIEFHADRIDLVSQLGSPDIGVFFFGLLLTACLQARRVRGAILWGILLTTLLVLTLRFWVVPALPAEVGELPAVAGSKLMTQLATPADWRIVAAPPDIRPTLLKMDLVRAVDWRMLPFVFIFLFMVLFDTIGTLIGVSQQAGFIKDNRLPRARQAFVSDAVGTLCGAAMGTSTVTSFIESAAGVEQGGRTGLTAVVAAMLFLVALFFSPVIALVGSYPPITAPALVIVGSLMMANVARIEWSNYAEAFPAFLVIVGIPFSYNIADGLALGFVSYPLVKLAAGQGRQVRWLSYVMAVVLVAYFAFVRV